MASASSSDDNRREEYDVFISFRGSDVRYGFLSHVVAALRRKQIKAFMDDTDLERGIEITPTLLKIIEQSKISIVIFSKDYPNSPWCLDELEKILDCKEKRKQIVVPVFYNVDPSDIQELRGNYAITNHTQQFPASKVDNWKRALMEISQLSGFDSENYMCKPEAILCDEMANDVVKKLSDLFPITLQMDGLFGIDSKIKDLELLIELEANGVKMVGIWGMGGIGKTTLADKVFNKLKNKFNGHCFVSNVKEALRSKTCGYKDLRDKIICKLLGERDITIDSPHSIDDSIRRRLQDIKVLIVLDDVDSPLQLHSLLEDSGLYSSRMFISGSRIIVTSRDKQVLENVNMEKHIYQVKQLSDFEALQLFSWHAFRQCYPQEEYNKLSRKAVYYCHGLPLALVVLGSQLKGKNREAWEATLEKFGSIPHLDILAILRTSFDGLDRDEKNIFLDIACFFTGDSIENVERILDCFGFHARNGIDRLCDKSLITNCEGIIKMHDLVQQMGQEIVVEQSGQKHENQSRLWRYEDIRDVLTNNGGSENLEIISLNLKKYDDDDIEISSKAFIHMRKLRFLRVIYSDYLHKYVIPHKVFLPEGLEFLPNSLKYLEWEYYPLSNLPSNFNLENLVELHMPYSRLEQLIWKKPLRNLKHICLKYSKYLTRILDLKKAPNLEVIEFSYCANLVDIGSSMGNLNKLTTLDLGGCRKLYQLPEIPVSVEEISHLRGSGIRQLISLKMLNISYCENLNKLPEHLGNLQSLERLYACGSGLKELPSSIQHLCKLQHLNLRDCHNLESLPHLPSNLKVLNAENCMSLKSVPATFKFPNGYSNLRNCGKLNEGASLIAQEIPWEIKLLSADQGPRLCIVGSEVPQWMKYRNDRRYFVDLELDVAHGSSIDVIFCAVVAAHPLQYINIWANLRDDCGNSSRNYGFDFPGYEFDDTKINFNFKHVFLWYDRVEQNISGGCRAAFSAEPRSYTQIFKCGVHPITENRKRKHEEDEEETTLESNSDEETTPESNLDVNLCVGMSASHSS